MDAVLRIRSIATKGSLGIVVVQLSNILNLGEHVNRGFSFDVTTLGLHGYSKLPLTPSNTVPVGTVELIFEKDKIAMPLTRLHDDLLIWFENTFEEAKQAAGNMKDSHVIKNVSFGNGHRGFPFFAYSLIMEGPEQDDTNYEMHTNATRALVSWITSVLDGVHTTRHAITLLSEELKHIQPFARHQKFEPGILKAFVARTLPHVRSLMRLAMYRAALSVYKFSWLLGDVVHYAMESVTDVALLSVKKAISKFFLRLSQSGRTMQEATMRSWDPAEDFSPDVVYTESTVSLLQDLENVLVRLNRLDVGVRMSDSLQKALSDVENIVDVPASVAGVLEFSVGMMSGLRVASTTGKMIWVAFVARSIYGGYASNPHVAELGKKTFEAILSPSFGRLVVAASGLIPDFPPAGGKPQPQKEFPGDVDLLRIEMSKLSLALAENPYHSKAKQARDLLSEAREVKAEAASVAGNIVFNTKGLGVGLHDFRRSEKENAVDFYVALLHGEDVSGQRFNAIRDVTWAVGRSVLYHFAAKQLVTKQITALLAEIRLDKPTRTKTVPLPVAIPPAVPAARGYGVRTEEEERRRVAARRRQEARLRAIQRQQSLEDAVENDNAARATARATGGVVGFIWNLFSFEWLSSPSPFSVVPESVPATREVVRSRERGDLGSLRRRIVSSIRDLGANAIVIGAFAFVGSFALFSWYDSLHNLEQDLWTMSQRTLVRSGWIDTVLRTQSRSEAHFINTFQPIGNITAETVLGNMCPSFPAEIQPWFEFARHLLSNPQTLALLSAGGMVMVGGIAAATFPQAIIAIVFSAVAGGYSATVIAMLLRRLIGLDSMRIVAQIFGNYTAEIPNAITTMGRPRDLRLTTAESLFASIISEFFSVPEQHFDASPSIAMLITWGVPVAVWGWLRKNRVAGIAAKYASMLAVSSAGVGLLTTGLEVGLGLQIATEAAWLKALVVILGMDLAATLYSRYFVHDSEQAQVEFNELDSDMLDFVASEFEEQ